MSNLSEKKQIVYTHGYVKDVLLSVNAKNIDPENPVYFLEIIPDKLRIRNVNRFDLDRTKHPVWMKDGYFYPPTERIVIEWIHNDLNASSERYNVIDRTLLSLRLLKSGQVSVPVIYDFIDDNNWWENKFESWVDPKTHFLSRKYYELDTNNGSILKEIVEHILNVDFEKEKAFRIACDRFTRYFDDVYEEDRLIDICIARAQKKHQVTNHIKRHSIAGTKHMKY